MGNAILKITDGTTTVNLLANRNGYGLVDWTPALPGIKSDGTWQDNAFNNGRSLSHYVYENAIETFSLTLHGPDQDSAIRKSQDLRRLLDKARKYWITKWQNEPVWIEARGSGETNTRYALVMNWSTPSDDNPYAAPFYNCPDVLMRELTLIIERSHWRDVQPGTVACVQASALIDYPDAGALISAPCATGTKITSSFQPAASTDDAYVNETDGTIDTSDTNLIIGTIGDALSAEQYHTGIIFKNVTVPKHAAICAAYIQFVSTFNGTCAATYYAEVPIGDADDAQPYSTYADFMGRGLSAVSVYGTFSPAAPGSTWNSPSLINIIRTLTNRWDWFSGNDIAIQIRAQFSAVEGYAAAASYDHLTYTAPRLIIEYVDTVIDPPFGQAATCSQDIFIGNKSLENNISNVYRYDSSGTSWSANLIGGSETLPFNLLPAAPASNDAAYFGIDSTLANSGPFSSVVLDLSVAQSGCTILWEYWNGATWATLSVANTGSFGGFQSTGVQSYNWTQPSAWTTVNLLTLLGGSAPNITGWWVRARVSAGTSATAVTQRNRLPYTSSNAFVEIDSTAIGGDVSALARISAISLITPTTNVHDRLIVALRQTSRGLNFRPHINFYGNGPGSIYTVYGDAQIVTTATTLSQTGAVLRYTPNVSDGVQYQHGYILLYPVREYNGVFRIFLRCKQNNGTAGDFGFALRFGQNRSQTLYQTTEVFTVVKDQLHLLDMGIVELPPGGVLSDVDENTGITISTIISNTNAAYPTLDLYDLILMPADEWIGDFLYYETGNRFVLSGTSLYYDIDSATTPKSALRANLRYRTNDSIYMPPLTRIASGSFALTPNSTQRIWFLQEGLPYPTGNIRVPNHEMGLQVKIEGIKQYLSMRGNR